MSQRAFLLRLAVVFPKPLSQAQVNALLTGEWCDEFTPEQRAYLSGRPEGPNCMVGPAPDLRQVPPCGHLTWLRENAPRALQAESPDATMPESLQNRAGAL